MVRHEEPIPNLQLDPRIVVAPRRSFVPTVVPEFRRRTTTTFLYNRPIRFRTGREPGFTPIEFLTHSFPQISLVLLLNNRLAEAVTAAIATDAVATVIAQLNFVCDDADRELLRQRRQRYRKPRNVLCNFGFVFGRSLCGFNYGCFLSRYLLEAFL